MIPIIYEKTETAFANNGLGRLRDCISCVVTEERNGIYECDIEYPVDGANYDLIQIGRIVGVTHDESGDIQPFDIVSYTRPIDGIVTFHAVHISYRLCYMSVRSSVAINSLADAFTHIRTYATPSCPFNFWTDKTSTGFCGALESVPRTVRQVLGGVEGSILDAYGGEYEWDLWQVKLWANRGQARDFSIRYGVNMLEYSEEYDASGCYSSCRPFWTDGTTTVVGDKQKAGGLPPSGREQCVPLDLSEKFEEMPTKAQVEAAALSVIGSKAPTLPAQKIEVSFVRLQDIGEFSAYENLLQCKLCDTINVIFPDFNSSGQFKIVKTVWNVLNGKYESMGLGELSTSLSEALGITDAQNSSRATIEQIQKELTVTTPTLEISTTTGTKNAHTVRQYGKVVQLHIQVRNTASTTSGQNIYAGTIDTPSLLPLMTTTSATYYGAYALTATISTAGAITVRNSNGSAFAAPTGNNWLNISFTYIVA